MKKERETVPADIKRLLLIECGFKCSVPNCAIQWPTLQFHHIDEDPANNQTNNILLLCPTHHQMVTSKHIDRKSCELLKQSLTAFAVYQLPPQAELRNRLLYSLAAEVYVNSGILSDKKFTAAVLDRKGVVVFPRLLRSVLDQAISSGAFIGEMDAKLFRLLFGWSESLNEFNHRLDLTEHRTIVLQPGQAETAIWHAKLVEGRGLVSTKQACADLIRHLLENYSEESGVNAETVFFADEARTSE